MVPKMQVRQQECCCQKNLTVIIAFFPSIDKADLAYSVQNIDFFLFMAAHVCEVIKAFTHHFSHDQSWFWQVVIKARLQRNIIQIGGKYTLFNCVWFPHSISKSYPVIESKKNHDKRNKKEHKFIHDTAAEQVKQHQQCNNERTCKLQKL